MRPRIAPKSPYRKARSAPLTLALVGAFTLLAGPARAADPAPPSAPAMKRAPPADLPLGSSNVERPGKYLRLTWDANIDGGLGAMFLSPARLTGFLRVRGGMVVFDERDIRAPKFYSLGLTYEASTFLHASSAIGLQAEAMNVGSGFWAQAGVVTDFQPRPGFNASVGWSVFGAEGQLRWDRDRTEGEAVWGVFGKLRLPITWFRVGRSR